MPEMPEVETYVRELAPLLAGRNVVGARVLWPRTIAVPLPDEFEQLMIGEGFTTFGRRGKYMLLGLTSGATLIVHLRMTGRVLVEAATAPIPSHTHVVLDLDDGRQVRYQDSRKFGRLWLVPDAALILRKLGPEPLSEEFTVEGFAGRLAGRSASIKALLLDQTIVAGAGNIYADEALFRAAIHPARLGGSLSPGEVAALHQALADVLADGIAHAGSSLGTSGLQNYSRPGGQPGGFQEQFRVFRRTGKPCFICNTPIVRIILAQRSTHYCPVCQH